MVQSEKINMFKQQFENLREGVAKEIRWAKCHEDNVIIDAKLYILGQVKHIIDEYL